MIIKFCCFIEYFSSLLFLMYQGFFDPFGILTLGSGNLTL